MKAVVGIRLVDVYVCDKCSRCYFVSSLTSLKSAPASTQETDGPLLIFVQSLSVDVGHNGDLVSTHKTGSDGTLSEVSSKLASS